MSDFNIKIAFKDWVEPDTAHYFLACFLGIMKYDESQDTWIRVKGVFNTNNPVSDVLFKMLETAVIGKMLEKNDDLQYRWNPEFGKYLYWEH